jgi:CRP-like cAMP-binding protein
MAGHAQGTMLAERALSGKVKGKGKKQESGLVGPGSILGGAAFLSSTRSRAAVRAASTCHIAAFGPQELEALLVHAWPAYTAPPMCKIAVYFWWSFGVMVWVAGFLVP